MKAQTAIEYFAIVSVALTILIPLVLYANQLLIGYNDETKISLAENAVREIGENADWVYAQGPPAKTTFEVYMPRNIDDVEIHDKVIIIKVRTSAGISPAYYNTVPDVQGSLPLSEGYYKVSVIAFQNFVSISW